MKEQDVVQQAMLGKVAGMFKEAVEKAVTAKTKKYKSSNASLRSELDAIKKKLEGAEAEFQPMVEKARTAEGKAKHMETRADEMKVTVEALQTQNADLKRKLAAAVSRKRR